MQILNTYIHRLCYYCAKILHIAKCYDVKVLRDSTRKQVEHLKDLFQFITLHLTSFKLIKKTQNKITNLTRFYLFKLQRLIKIEKEKKLLFERISFIQNIITKL